MIVFISGRGVWKKEGYEKYLFLHKGNYDNTPDSYKWVFGDTYTEPGSSIVSGMFESLDGIECPITNTDWFFNKGTLNNVEWVQEEVDIFCLSTAQKEGMEIVALVHLFAGFTYFVFLL